MWFGFLPEDYSEWENKAPQCALFSAFLRPDISPAAGRTLPQWHNGCVREEAPLTPAVWLADPGRAGAPAVADSTSPRDNAIKGMLYIPHVVLWHKLGGDARRSLRWIIPP